MKIIERTVSNPFSIFVGACLHIGSSTVDYDKLRADLKEARKRKSRIILCGDIFDAILPSDPRSTMSGIDDRLLGENDLIDRAIKLGFKALEPYADLIDAIGDGNHEWQLFKRHNTNMNNRLVEMLNDKCGTDIKYGGYMFYMLYKMKRKGSDLSSRIFKTLVYHGKGGSSPTTKGMGDVAKIRNAGFEYDLYLCAHKHKAFATEDIQTRPMPSMKTKEAYIKETICKSVQVGSYKKNVELQRIDSSDIASWEEKMGFGQSVTGGKFVTVNLVRKETQGTECYNFDIKAEI